MTSRLMRVVWTLIALCLPALLQAAPAKFISSGEQAYVEVAPDGRKLYTESRGDYKALLLLGERNNPELLKLSFIDASKKIVTVVVAFRPDEKTAAAQADNKFIRSLSSDADGFDDWQARFSSYPDQPTMSFVYTNPSFADPIGTEIVDARGGFVFKMKDWVCQCKQASNVAACAILGIDCLMNVLCDIWDCLTTGHWTGECNDRLEYARRVCSTDEFQE